MFQTLNTTQPTPSPLNHRTPLPQLQTVGPNNSDQAVSTMLPQGQSVSGGSAPSGTFALPPVPPNGVNGSPRDQDLPLLSPNAPPQSPSTQASRPLHAQPPTIPGALQSNISNSSLPVLRPSFGVSLEELLKRDGSAIPLVVYQCIQAIDLFGLEVEGIYRLSGSSAHIGRLKAMFDNGEHAETPRGMM